MNNYLEDEVIWLREENKRLRDWVYRLLSHNIAPPENIENQREEIRERFSIKRGVE